MIECDDDYLVTYFIKKTNIYDRISTTEISIFL